MGTAIAVISIVSAALSGLYMGWQGWSQGAGSVVKQHAANIVNDFRKAIESGRLNVNKLISLLQSKNSNGLLTYLQNNPAITRKLDNLLHNNDLIAEIQAQQSTLEQQINDCLSQLSQMGYSGTIIGSSKEGSRANKIKKDLDNYRKQYEDLGKQAANIDTSTVEPATTYTRDLDARSQNINGGINNVSQK